MPDETWILDPSEVATDRVELNINEGAITISADGVDLGNAEIAAYMAEQQRGASVVDFRIPNRTITIPLIVRTSGMTFAEARYTLASKVARIQQEGGWLKRVTAGGAAMYADLVNASLDLPDSWQGLHGDIEPDVVLTLEALPDFYGDEVPLAEHGPRTNLITNPSYETNLTGLLESPNEVPDAALSRVNDWSEVGTWSARLTGTSAGSITDGAWVSAYLNTAIACDPGDRFVLSLTANIGNAAAAGYGAFIRLEFRDGSNALLSSLNSEGITATGEHVFKVTAAAPEDAAVVMASIHNYTEANSDTLDIRWDAVLLELIVFDFAALDRSPTRSELYANFTTKPDFGPVSDGALVATADTGQEIRATGQDASIAGGKLQWIPQGAGYVQSDPLSENITGLGGRITFSPYTTNAASAGIITWTYSMFDAPFPPDSAVHLIVGPEDFLWSYIFEQDIIPIYGGFFDPPLAADNTTVHEFWAVTDGDTLLFKMPDGSYHFVVHDKIAELPGPIASFENLSDEDLGHPTARFTEVWADTTPVSLPQIFGDYFDGSIPGNAWTGTAHGSTSRTHLPELSFVENNIRGDYPGRVRIVTSDDSAQDQRGLIWSFRSRHYDSVDTAAPSYEAEALEALDTAVVAAKAGASGGSVVTHGTISTNWTPVVGSNLNGTAYLTHQGTYRVFSRVLSTSGTTVSARLVWDVGDLVNPVENLPTRLYDGGTFHVIDLGEVRLDAAGVPAATHRWQGQIQVKGDYGGEAVSVDKVWIVNSDEGFGVMRAPLRSAIGAIDYSARSEFRTEAGSITGDSLQLGGTWAGAGDVDDFVAVHYGSGPPGGMPIGGTAIAARAAVSDVDLTGGRYVTASATSAMTTQSAQVDHAFSAASGAVGRFGVLARYVNFANTLFFGFDGLFLVAVKHVSGVATTLGAATTPRLKPGTWYTLRLTVSPGGFWVGHIGTSGGNLEPVLSGYDPVFATGGGLAGGAAGIYDAQTSAVTNIRAYGNFAAWAPIPDAVIYASQSAELATNGLTRLDTGGTAYGPISYPIGDLPRIPPAGLESRTTEVFLKASRGDLQSLADTAIDDLVARVYYRPSWLSVPEF